MQSDHKVAAAGALGLLLVIGGAFLFVGQEVEPEVVAPDCLDTINPELSENELFRIANEHFRGHDEYRLDCATLAFAYVLKQNPEYNDHVWYQAGRVDFLHGRLGDAVAKFDEQIERFGTVEPAVYYMRGLTTAFIALEYDKPGHWESAEADFRTYLELNSQSPWAMTDLSWTLFMQEKYEEQLALTSEGVATYNTNAWLHNMHGLALLNTGDQEGAVAAFTRAKELAGDLTPEWWGAAYPGNDPRLYENGLTEFRTAIERNLALAKGGPEAY